jgi:hypothetical protein
MTFLYLARYGFLAAIVLVIGILLYAHIKTIRLR